MSDKCETFVARWDHAMCSTCGAAHAPTPTPAPGLDLDAVDEAERAMAPGEWRVDWTYVTAAGGPVATCIGPNAEHDAAGIVALKNAAPAMFAEVRALRAAAEEREADMHARIRAGYDKTVADAWRAEVAKRDAEIADLRALVESQRRDYLDVRLTAELAAARAVPADVEAAIEDLRRAEEVDARAMTGQSLAARVLAEANLRTAIARAISDATAARGTVGGLLATEPVGSIVEFVSPDGMYHQAVVAGGRLLSRRWQHALSHSPGDWTLYAFWLDGAYLRLPARLVPAAEADADPSQRGPLPKGG